MKFLEIKNLSRIYTAGKDISQTALELSHLEIEKGEFLVISGPSGSGKTTLLNLIGGLDAPTTGHVFLEEHEITGLKEKDLSRVRLEHIGFIFQAYNLIPVLTARENIEYIMILQGISKPERERRTREAAARLGIEELLDKKPGEMSGGQQQRVAVARAVVSEPSLILADEPTANLDSVTGENLMEMMKHLNEQKKITVIFSSHDPMVISKARRHIVLRDGKISSDQIVSQ